ncbi:radical SAM protein [Patescibacteria group bacterium]|nr:radical SAM protein [Patescibacteria group bacterium]
MKVIFNPQMKLLWHWDKINAWLKSGDAMPVLIEIAPTNYCNAECPWCFYAGNKNGEKIDKEVMLKTLSQLSSAGVKAISWTGGGEPTLHPNFNEFAKHANSLGYSQGLFTNALDYEKNRVDPEYFEWIRISLTEKYMDGIDKKLLKEYVDSKTPIGICLNITKENYDDAYKYAKEAKELGVDYFQVRPALAKLYKEQPKFEVPEKLKELEDDKFKIFLSEYKFADSVQPRSYDVCYGHFFCPVIDYNGDVNVCMYKLGKKGYILGNLYKDSFLDIWSGEKRKEIKKCKLVNTDCQVCCKNHEINKLLYHIKHPEKESNIDFI